MTQVKRIEYGSEKVSLFAEPGQFDLVIADLGVIASAKTRREMIAKLDDISGDLHDIRWELDKEYGPFKGFDKPEEEPKEEPKEEAAGE